MSQNSENNSIDMDLVSMDDTNDEMLDLALNSIDDSESANNQNLLSNQQSTSSTNNPTVGDDVDDQPITRALQEMSLEEALNHFRQMDEQRRAARRLNERAPLPRRVNQGEDAVEEVPGLFTDDNIDDPAPLENPNSPENVFHDVRELFAQVANNCSSLTNPNKGCCSHCLYAKNTPGFGGDLFANQIGIDFTSFASSSHKRCHESSSSNHDGCKKTKISNSPDPKRSDDDSDEDEDPNQPSTSRK
ncbi:unnamed protein product [Caenorhabditis bovis]|uniref:Uncharacterized protein n=1 Tax=Caenorhabditis bovis TaxID=2654633 RepID=A0A8S1E7V5_9PELO|nr:unnamed protein product [Caenorhabditis bovis]